MDSVELELQIKIQEMPHNPLFYFRLIEHWRNCGDQSDKIITLLEKAMDIFPNNIKVLTEIAAVYEFELGDVEKAKAYYEKILKIDSQNQLALQAIDGFQSR